MEFADVVEMKSLSWVIFASPKYHQVLLSKKGGRRGSASVICYERLSLIFLALKVKEETVSQRMWVVSSSWRRQGDRFFLEPPERNYSLTTHWL